MNNSAGDQQNLPWQVDVSWAQLVHTHTILKGDPISLNKLNCKKDLHVHWRVVSKKKNKLVSAVKSSEYQTKHIYFLHVSTWLQNKISRSEAKSVVTGHFGVLEILPLAYTGCREMLGRHGDKVYDSQGARGTYVRKIPTK